MNNKGFSLIELIITIVILSFGGVLLLTLMNASTKNSIDPMIRQQANAIARSYLEEISLRSFCDPDFSTDCPTDCNTGDVCTACSLSGGESRATFDDVCDYDGLNDLTGAVDQTGGAVITGLEDYNIQVTVDDGSDGSEAVLNTLSSANRDVVRIDVIVAHDAISTVDVTVSGYRANY
jgi:MSHA pilin protein MshD